MTEKGDSALQHILEVATEVFATQGLAGARVDDIAARAGISKGLIYYHLGDKESLYAAVMRRTLEEARSALSNAVDGIREPENRLRRIVFAIAELAYANPHFAPLMLREIATGGAGLPDEVLTEMRRVFQVLGDVLVEGAATKSFRQIDPVKTHMLVAGSVLVLIAGAPIRRRLRGEGIPKNPEAIADYVSSLLLDGIRERAPRARGRSGRTRTRTR